MQGCIQSFNTQPPEGGWEVAVFAAFLDGEFQHTAARRRLAASKWRCFRPTMVSTHSRPKAAGKFSGFAGTIQQSFNTQPPEGGWVLVS